MTSNKNQTLYSDISMIKLKCQADLINSCDATTACILSVRTILSL
jgi:hypothetical protein